MENGEDDIFRKDSTVSEDFPSIVMKARNNLRGFLLLRNALKDKKEAYLKYDELIIDCEIFDDTSEDIVQVQTER